jgi:hypothetical protein
LIVGLEVPESCDDLGVVVDSLAAAAALTQDVPVFEAGDDVLDAGADAAVFAVVVVVDDPAAVVALWTGDGGVGAVSAVAQDDTTIEQRRHGVAGNDDVVAVTWPALAGGDHTSPVSADDDLGVDAAAAVLADRSDRLVGHRDQRALDDPGVSAVVRGGPQGVRHRYEVVDDPVHCRLAGAKQRRQRPCGQVGAQMDHDQQQPDAQRQPPGAVSRLWDLMRDLYEHSAELVFG